MTHTYPCVVEELAEVVIEPERRGNLGDGTRKLIFSLPNNIHLLCIVPHMPGVAVVTNKLRIIDSQFLE